MASGYTTNYGLCQWQGEDKFLREEFNQDNAKIDEVLGAVDTRTAGFPEVEYHTYNLLLQNYYDGKQTGYKRGLIFDGFLDTDQIERKSEEVLYDGKNSMVLHRVGQRDLEQPYSADRYNTSATLQFTVTGGGMWTGVTYRLYNVKGGDGNVKLTYTVKLNGKTLLNETYYTERFQNAATYLPIQHIFTTPYQVCVGDVCAVTVSTDTNYTGQVQLAETGSGMGGILHFTPIEAAQGELETVARALPAFQRLKGWVRHRGGAFTLSLKTEDGELLPFAQSETRETTELFGRSCTETAVTLDVPMAAGSWSLIFALDARTDDYLALYDYGVMLL